MHSELWHYRVTDEEGAANLATCENFHLLNPNQSLGFMPEQNLFLAGCEEIVDDIAGYGETISEKCD